MPYDQHGHYTDYHSLLLAAKILMSSTSYSVRIKMSSVHTYVRMCVCAQTHKPLLPPPSGLSKKEENKMKEPKLLYHQFRPCANIHHLLLHLGWCNDCCSVFDYFCDYT